MSCECFLRRMYEHGCESKRDGVNSHRTNEPAIRDAQSYHKY